MQVVKQSDWLIAENKNGGRKYWRLYMTQYNDKYYTQTHWYQITKTGRASKEQYSDPYYCAPTNVGRANERNSKDQAEFEFDAILKKQRDKGFLYEGEKSKSHQMPMLAHKFRDHTDKVEWPCYIQPKLNGIRMLFDGTVGWSRGNKAVIPEVIQHLQFDTSGHVLDGELMLPGNVLLQESMSAIKKFRPELSPTLIYHVYDVVDNTLPYAARLEIIAEVCKNAPANVKVVNTLLCRTEEEVNKNHKKFVSNGYEGTMIRNPHMVYEIGKRSYSLLKLKDFQDAEYRIVDIIDGDGSDKNLAIFILETDSGNRFNCRPEGSQENRADLYINRPKLIGKYLTVRFFELSKDGIPIFPVGVGIRDLKDFS
jgi:ATP-dependent DNA ligase